jgi:hypothetical protein
MPRPCGLAVELSGKPKGSTLTQDVFLQNHKDIIRLLKAGQSVRHTAKITGKKSRLCSAQKSTSTKCCKPLQYFLEFLNNTFESKVSMPEVTIVEKRESERTDAPSTIGWGEFLTGHPPLKPRLVIGAASHTAPPYQNFVVQTPDLVLHCPSEKCSGDRIFRYDGRQSPAFPLNNWNRVFLPYRCRNCEITTKEYALRIRWCFAPENDPRGKPQLNRVQMEAQLASLIRAANESTPAEVVKFGEWPPLGPSIPKKLLNFFEKSEKTLFLSGRRAEGLGMGIAAFAYYRRVV